MAGSSPRPPSEARKDRCRLVLVMTGDQLVEFGGRAASLLQSACDAGDVASVIIAQNTLEGHEFAPLLKPVLEATRPFETAVVIAGESRIATRVGSDGVQFGQNADDVRDGVERLTPRMIVGAGNVRNRHAALIIGEADPDYVFFGKAGDDTRPDPLPRNLDLAQWWAAMIEIPCIVLGGSSLQSVVAASATKAEFVALGSAIFAPDADDNGPISEKTVAERVAQANSLLDQHAPDLAADTP